MAAAGHACMHACAHPSRVAACHTVSPGGAEAPAARNWPQGDQASAVTGPPPPGASGVRRQDEGARRPRAWGGGGGSPGAAPPTSPSLRAAHRPSPPDANPTASVARAHGRHASAETGPQAMHAGASEAAVDTQRRRAREHACGRLRRCARRTRTRR